MTAPAAHPPATSAPAPALERAGDERDGTEIMLGFARALRAAGVVVTADREREFLAAAALLGADSAGGVYHAGRATLCASPADLARHDLVFSAYFAGELGGRKRAATAPPLVLGGEDQPGEGGESDSDPDLIRAAASDLEILRHKDIAALSPEEKRRLDALFGGLRPRSPMRRAHRRQPARRGAVDPHRTLRESLRRFGEPGPIAHRRRTRRPRRVVLLLDVSGSMSAYADALLRLAHAFARTGMPVETFTLGTRLTQVTRGLAVRDGDRAVNAAGALIPDYSGGTRLADGLAAFLHGWGRRGMARGAVVVVFSDGWERGDPAALGEQMRRLRALAHAVVWANPHRGHPAYRPVQGGIVAALPHIDHFVAGHSLAAFEELIEVVAGA